MMSRLAAFAALFPLAVAAPAAAQDSRDALTLSWVIQKLDLGTLSVFGETARDGETITFADYGYTDVEIADGTATVSAPDLVWTYTLRALDEGGAGPAICLKVQGSDRRYVQGAWRLSEDGNGYLRGVKFNSETCHNIVVTGQRMQRRDFSIPQPGPYFPPDEPLVPRREPYFPPDEPFAPRLEPYSPPERPLRPPPQFPD